MYQQGDKDVASTTYQALIGSFRAAAEADQRIAAAFVGGSRGAGSADEHADIDLYLILRDDAYDDFFAERRAFMAQLGNPAFLEDFNGFGFDMLLFIYSNAVEGELVLARETGFEEMPSGPFLALVDRQGILPPGGAFPPIKQPAEQEQCEHLHFMVHWFWRDLSQLSRWMARGRHWSAYGHLEMMRHTCLNLARLHYDFTGRLESYHKIEGVADPDDLVAFQHSFCRVEREAILQAVRALVEIYLRLAPPLAAAHDIAYPAKLQGVVMRRLEQATGVGLILTTDHRPLTTGDPFHWVCANT